MPDPSFQKKRDFAHASATPDHSNRYAVRCRKTRNIKSNRGNKVRKDRRDDSGPRLPSARCFFTRQDRFFISGADTNRRLYDYDPLIFQGHSFCDASFPGPFPQPVRSMPKRHASQKSGQGRTRIAGPLPNRPVPQLPRPSPENRRTRKRHRLGVVPVPFRCRRPKIAHGLPRGGRPPFFFPSKRSDTVPQVRNARRRQPFPSREGHRPAKRTLRRSGRPGVFLTGTAATKCRYGRHETAIAVSRHGCPGNKSNANGRIQQNAAVFLCVGPSGSDEVPGPIRAMRRFSPPARFRGIRRPDGRRPARL